MKEKINIKMRELFEKLKKFIENIQKDEKKMKEFEEKIKNKNFKEEKKERNYFFSQDIYQGLFIIFKNFFTKKVTLNYPFEKASLGNRFRGEHVLRIYEEIYQERCIICKLCEISCPAKAITINIEEKLQLEQKKENSTNEILRKSMKYDIDMTKCIFCGICQESCPVDAIVESSNTNYAFEEHAEFLYNKDKLIENGILYESEVSYNLLINSKYR